MNLAQRYHNNVTVQPLMAESSSIALLQPPPSWGLASNADSDWVIRARMLKDQGTKLNRHQRKNRKKLGNGTDYINDNETESISMMSTSMISTIYPEKGDKPPLLAVIASGTGPDGRAEARKLKKKRKVLTQSVVVIVFSIFALTAKSYFFSTQIPKQSPAHKQITVEEESISLSDVALDESKQHETTTIASDHEQPDPSETAIDPSETAISAEDEPHAESILAALIPANEEVESQVNDEYSSTQNESDEYSSTQNESEEYSSTQNESEDAPASCNIIRNESEGADSDMQLLVESTSIAVVTPNRSEQLARAIGQIKAAVEEEISFECKGSTRTAEAAQEIWRKQANSIKTQGERILNFSKACLAQEARKDVVETAR